MAFEAVVQLGVKGQQLVLSTLQKLEEQKKKFSKAVSTAVSAAAPGAAGAAESAKSSDEKQQQRAQTELTKAMAGAAKELSGSAAAMDPTRFLTAVAAVGPRLMGAIPFMSGAADAAEHVLRTGIEMATNAVSQVKAAVPEAMRAYEVEARGRATFGAGSGGSVALDQSRFMQAERAQLQATIFQRYGKIVGTELKTEIDKLIASNKDVAQTIAVAGGNFDALGTDTGFFLNQISQQTAGMPPSIARAVQAELLKALPQSEKDAMIESADFRKSAVAFEQADISVKKRVAGTLNDRTTRENIIALNNELGTLQVNLVSAGSKLSGLVSRFAGSINTIVDEINRLSGSGGGRRR